MCCEQLAYLEKMAKKKGGAKGKGGGPPPTPPTAAKKETPMAEVDVAVVKEIVKAQEKQVSRRKKRQ